MTNPWRGGRSINVDGCGNWRGGVRQPEGFIRKINIDRYCREIIKFCIKMKASADVHNKWSNLLDACGRE
jgi:hypothetical protein